VQKGEKRKPVKEREDMDFRSGKKGKRLLIRSTEEEGGLRRRTEREEKK
jgi:hypothetical protein